MRSGWTATAPPSTLYAPLGHCKIGSKGKYCRMRTCSRFYPRSTSLGIHTCERQGELSLDNRALDSSPYSPYVISSVDITLKVSGCGKHETVHVVLHLAALQLSQTRVMWGESSFIISNV